MANDRIYIKSMISGKDLCIGKHMGMGWYCPDDLYDKLNKFYSDHTEEFFEHTHSFEIFYENTEE